MQRYFRRLSYLGILLATPLMAATSLIYVPNNAGTTISVIDPATNKVVGVIENIEAPEAVGFSPDGGRVYITSYGEENVLTVVDRKTGKHIKKVPLSGVANDLMVTKDGRQVVICIEIPGALDIVDTTSFEVKTIPLKFDLHDIVLTGDSKYAVAGSGDGDSATVFDLQSEQIAWEIKFGKGEGVRPLAMENGPDGSGRRIFLQLRGLNGFAVVDFAKREEVARIKLTNESSGFGGAPFRQGHGIGVAPDGKTLWVNSRAANSVFVYSLPEIKLLGRVPFPELRLPGKAPIGANGHWITFTPDSKTAYIPLSELKSVSAIDVKTRKEVTRIPVGESPGRVTTLVLP